MRKEFLGHASRLFSWTVAGQIFGLLSAPIVARLFDPEAYGIAAMVITAAGTLAIASSFRYAQAIVVADDDGEAAYLEQLARNIVIGTGVTCLLACLWLYVFPPVAVDEFFKSSRYLLFAIPVIVVLNGYAMVRRRALNREKFYSRIGIAALSNSVMVPLSRIIAGLACYGSAVFLVLGSAMGWMAEVVQLRSVRRNAHPGSGRPAKGTLWAMARKYSDFPKYSLPEGLLSNVSIQLPIYTLGFIYSPAVTGLYALASRMVRLPVLALSAAVAQVLTRQFDERRRAGGRLSMPVAKSSFGLFVIASLIGLPIMFFGETLFRVIMGESWAVAGIYAATLIPWIVSTVAFIPANLTFTIIRRQELRLISQIGLFLLRVLIMASAAIFQFGVLNTLWLFSLTSAAYNFFLIGFVIFLLTSEKPNPEPRAESV